jgi:hypothetical protein
MGGAVSYEKGTHIDIASVWVHPAVSVLTNGTKPETLNPEP